MYLNLNSLCSKSRILYYNIINIQQWTCKFFFLNLFTPTAPSTETEKYAQAMHQGIFHLSLVVAS